jgi:hypothetical protein
MEHSSPALRLTLYNTSTIKFPPTALRRTHPPSAHGTNSLRDRDTSTAPLNKASVPHHTPTACDVSDAPLHVRPVASLPTSGGDLRHCSTVAPARTLAAPDAPRPPCPTSAPPYPLYRARPRDQARPIPARNTSPSQRSRPPRRRTRRAQAALPPPRATLSLVLRTPNGAARRSHRRACLVGHTHKFDDRTACAVHSLEPPP